MDGHYKHIIFNNKIIIAATIIEYKLFYMYISMSVLTDLSSHFTDEFWDVNLFT